MTESISRSGFATFGAACRGCAGQVLHQRQGEIRVGQHSRPAARSVPVLGVLVETLLDRGTDGDVAEAEAAIVRLAATPADEGLALREIWLLRLRALLVRAQAHRSP